MSASATTSSRGSPPTATVLSVRAARVRPVTAPILPAVAVGAVRLVPAAPAAVTVPGTPSERKAAVSDHSRPDHGVAAEFEADRRAVDACFARLDALRADATRRLDRTRRSRAGGNLANRTERDAFDSYYSRRLAALAGVEDRLVFGRLDTAAGERTYIGRIGLADESTSQLLVDWRAPAAARFYRATAAQPDGIARRRHLHLAGRHLVGVDDDVLDPTAVDPATVSDGGVYGGGGALLRAVTAARTGRMHDIVATLAAEQDEIIRDTAAGVLLVTGGPGTGKTAVALHRIAFLLYTYADRLAKSGVLLVGPSQAFCRYIGDVLPSLGETGVVTTTFETLLPGVEVTGTDSPPVAVVKGDERMAEVLAAAVRSYQRIPRETLTLDVQGVRLRFRPRLAVTAASSVQHRGLAHNPGRIVFCRHVLEALAEQYLAVTGEDPTTYEPGELDALLRESRDVRREVNRCWRPLTATGLLARLYTDAAWRGSLTAGVLSPAESALLQRDTGDAWTRADVALLDELRTLVGQDDSGTTAAAARAAAEHAEAAAWARQALQGLGGQAAAMVSGRMLADRFAPAPDRLSAADAAASDLDWVYGHVVVDEAQELSAMEWRAVRRRAGGGSFTLVGDLAQTSSPAGAQDWEDALAWSAGRLRRHDLTVNYRTPGSVMDVARDVAAAYDLPTTPTKDLRDGGPPPRGVVVADDVAARSEAVRLAAERLGEPGTVALVLPATVPADVVAGVRAAIEERSGPVGERLIVGPTSGVKGLECDHVVVADPAGILAASERGAADLYVVASRATQTLTVVAVAGFPPGLQRLG